MNNTPYTDILKKNRFQIRDLSKKSQAWFTLQSGLLGQQITFAKMMQENTVNNKNIMRPGEMYLFQYDAKHKETLPHWDMYPLVFPFRILKDGFIGLNLHYLPIHLRAQLLDNLMQFKSNNRFDETTRLRANWQLLSSISRHKLIEPCVHRYLWEHTRSRFKKIDSPDWGTALLLPVEKFVGASKAQVWKNTR